MDRPPSGPRGTDLRRLVGDILLIWGGLGNAGLNPTTALDAATGRLRWTWPGQLLVAGDGRTGLGWRLPDDPVADRLDAAVLDLASGSTLWSIPGTSGRLLFEPDREFGPHLLLLTAAAGGVEVRDLRTGANVETRSGLPTDATAATIVGDSVLLSASGATGQSCPRTPCTRWRRGGAASKPRTSTT